ncbi:chromosome partitioning protein [Sphingomonas sp. SORGH_AS 950]|uniref:ParA family protein n=1 Tax=Sphingomonas sp. SORGH_AS_0950 TaxID=3041792 RepID=UPI00277FACA9|nr:ParA family protein [Sphingomonas sp. SORGH_AS_0950]MDQ1159587.1 chromosome partitioning protein [Sphingomonas sp. SORGH_AS_0950]
MPVITMLSPKGGVGKTTTALILATELAARGSTVVMIDADPNFPLTRWAQKDGRPSNIEVIPQIDEDEIIGTIDDARKQADYVIVDLEGKASARATNALMMSHLALVPIQGSELDAVEAARAFKVVRNAGTARQRPLPFAAVLTRTPASVRLWPRDLKAVVANLEGAGIPMIPTALAERGAFRGLFSIGGTLHEMTAADVGSLDSARQNATAFAYDVLSMLKEGLSA